MDKNQQEKNEVPTNPGPNTALTDRRVRNIRLIQRIILLLAAATLVLGIYYFREDIYDSYTKIRTQQQLAQQREDTVYSKIAFEPDSNNTYALFGTNLAVLNKSTYKLYSPEGEELISLSLGFTMPAMCISEEFVAVYDRGSTQIYILDHNTLVDTIHTGGALISVSFNEAGYMAVVREDELYRTVVSVYNPRQKLIYEWKSSDYYVMAARVSPKSNRLAAVAYTQNDGSFISRVVFFDFSSEEYLAQCDVDNAVMTNINFVSDDVLIAVGDTQCTAIRTDGEIVYTYDYGNDMLKSGAEASHIVVLSFVDRTSGLGAKIVAFGPENYTYAAAADEIREISICGDYVAVLYTQGIQVFDDQLQELTGEVAVSQVRKIIMNKDGLVMLIYASDAGFIDLISAFRNRG
jgi:hypothetical protein